MPEDSINEQEINHQPAYEKDEQIVKTIPLFPWSLFVTGGMLLLTLPILSGALLMVLADLHSNTLFFDVGMQISKRIPVT